MRRQRFGNHLTVDWTFQQKVFRKNLLAGPQAGEIQFVWCFRWCQVSYDEQHGVRAFIEGEERTVGSERDSVLGFPVRTEYRILRGERFQDVRVNVRRINIVICVEFAVVKKRVTKCAVHSFVVVQLLRPVDRAPAPGKSAVTDAEKRTGGIVAATETAKLLPLKIGIEESQRVGVDGTASMPDHAERLARAVEESAHPLEEIALGDGTRTRFHSDNGGHYAPDAMRM